MRHEPITPRPYTIKADRINELEGQEIEINHSLPEDTNTEQLAQAIFAEFEQNNKGNYRIAESLSHVAETETHQYQYSAINKDGKVKKLYTITVRPRDSAILIKKKGRKDTEGKAIIREEDEYALPYTNWDAEAEAAIKLEQAELIGASPDDILRTKAIKKTKLKIRLEHQKTNRVYTIGVVTKIDQAGQTKKSLSIEYVGRERNEQPEEVDDDSEEKIAKNLKKIDRRISSIVNLG